MAFAAYVLENAILLFSLGVAVARFFKAPPWGFCMNRPASRRGMGGGGGKDFSSFTKEKWQMPDRCAGDGHVWNWLSHYHLSLRPGGIITPGEDYHLSLPWGIITPGEDSHLSLSRGLLGLLHHCVEKSDLLSIFGLLHLLPLFLTNILVWSSSLLLAKEWWVGSIKSQVQSGCYSLFSNWLLC